MLWDMLQSQAAYEGHTRLSALPLGDVHNSTMFVLACRFARGKKMRSGSTSASVVVGIEDRAARDVKPQIM